MDAEKFDALLRAMDAGDESALKTIQQYYGRQIKWVAYSIINDWHYANDILNDVLTKLWNKSHKFRNIRSPDACIYDLAKKTSYDFYRKYLKKHKNEVRIDELSSGEAKTYLAADDSHFVDFLSMIAELDETEKEIVIKKIAFGYTHAMLAKELGMPEGTVKWKYRQILDKLKKNILP